MQDRVNKERQNTFHLNNNHIHLLTSSVSPLRNIQVEISGTCNLRCVMCREGKATHREKSFLSSNEFHDLLMGFDLHWLQVVKLAGETEPLINPDIVDILKICKQANVNIWITTNGMHLTPEVSSELVGWPGQIHISTAGASKHTFESIRRGADFDQICKNIKFLTEQKRVQNQSWPIVYLDPILMKSNIHELPETMRMASNLGCNAVNSYHLVVDTPTLIRESLYFDKQECNEMLKQSGELGKKLGLELSLPEPYSLDSKSCSHKSGDDDAWKQCRWLWQNALLTLDGLKPCCALSDHDLDFSKDIFRMPFRAVWNNKWYSETRSKFLNGDPPPLCKYCKDPGAKDKDSIMSYFADKMIPELLKYHKQYPGILTDDNLIEIEDCQRRVDKIKEDSGKLEKSAMLMGEEYFNKKMYDDAECMFKKCLNDDPNNTTALNNLGVICFSMNRIHEALVYFQKVLEIDPKNKDVIDNLTALEQIIEPSSV